jgi:hypothetical protein
MEKSKIGCVVQTTNGDFDPYVFEQTSSTSELTIELVRREMLIFNCYKLIPKKSSAFFNGEQNMKPCFLLFFGPPNRKDCWVTN